MGWSMRLRHYEETVNKIATLPRGDDFRASNVTDLKKVYRLPGTRLAPEKKQPTEVTAVFAAIGAALAMSGTLHSLLQYSRIL